MTAATPARPHGVAVLLCALLLAGCASVQQTRQLDDFKALAAKGDYATIAARDVSCDATDPACAQAQLLKGDACYRLAKAGDASRYACAADALGAGLVAPGLDQPAATRAAYTSNRCEALRQARDRVSGPPALARNKELAACAQALETLNPGSAAARFFAVNAGLAAVQIGPTDTTACARLDALAASLREREGAAAASGLDAPYRRLGNDLQLTRRGFGCR